VKRSDVTNLVAFERQLRDDLAVLDAFGIQAYGEWLEGYLEVIDRYKEHLAFLPPIPRLDGKGMTSAQFQWIRRRLRAIHEAARQTLAAREALEAAEDSLAEALADFGPPRSRGKAKSGSRTRGKSK